MSKVTGKHRALLEKPDKEHYKDYTNKGGDSLYLQSASNVRTMMKSNLRQCLYEYCANVDLKLRALGNICDKFNCRIRQLDGWKSNRRELNWLSKKLENNFLLRKTTKDWTDLPKSLFTEYIDTLPRTLKTRSAWHRASTCQEILI